MKGSIYDATGYIGSDGYMYTGGYGWGETTFYKQTNAGTGIVDYELNQGYGIVVNSSGTVKVGSRNTSASNTWSNVTVGGSTTNAVAVSMGQAYQMVLTNTDVLYVSLDGATSMTSIVSSSTTSASRDGIVDFAMGSSYQFVLYGNGDLYRGTAGALEASMTKVASNVEMIDHDYNSPYIFIYNSSNQIQYGSVVSSSFTTLVTEADVVQIRGGYYTSSRLVGWGYLTSDGTLKTYESSYNSTTATRTITDVDYFDNQHEGTWGYLKDGSMYFWVSSASSSSYTKLTTATSPTALTGTYASNNSFSISDLGEPTVASLENTPPA